MADPMTQAYDMTRAVQDEALKQAQRWQNWVDSFVLNPADPPMGMTPKDVVWKRGKIQLYRYHAQTASLNPIPYFIVPWLGALVYLIARGGKLVGVVVRRVESE